MRINWAILTLASLAGVTVSVGPDPLELHEAGVAAHLERRLAAAAVLYDEALALEPPHPARREQLDRVRALAPRIFTTSSEPFALRDVAAIIHPTSRTIAYHLFWEDDIDFPDDNDPSDHEVVWVRHTADGNRVERVWTYFHGRVLTWTPAPGDRPDRPRIQVQWGKHGSLPPGWEAMRITPEANEIVDGIPATDRAISLAEYLEGAYHKLSTTGRRLPTHPIAARLKWPSRFAGTRGDFMTFPREVDPRGFLDASTVLVSRFNSGTLSRWILPYNFRPKTEWPDE